MKTIDLLSRRNFLRNGLLTSAALAAATLPRTARGAVTRAMRDPFHGLKMGMASYSLRKFSLDQAIAMTRQAGLKYITLKDMHLSLKSTPEERKEARKKSKRPDWC